MTADRAKPSTRPQDFPSRGKRHAECVQKSRQISQIGSAVCFRPRGYLQHGQRATPFGQPSDASTVRDRSAKFLERCDSCGRINGGLSGQASCGPLVNVSMPLDTFLAQVEAEIGARLSKFVKEDFEMPFSNAASWPTAFCARAAPSAPMRRWSRLSYPPTLLRDSCYLLDHGN